MNRNKFRREKNHEIESRTNRGRPCLVAILHSADGYCCVIAATAGVCLWIRVSEHFVTSCDNSVTATAMVEEERIFEPYLMAGKLYCS